MLTFSPEAARAVKKIDLQSSVAHFFALRVFFFALRAVLLERTVYIQKKCSIRRGYGAKCFLK